MADRYQRLEGQEPSSSSVRQELNKTTRGESEQIRTSFIWQGIWWLVTFVFCAFILATIRIFEQKGNITNVQKHTLQYNRYRIDTRPGSELLCPSPFTCP